AVDTPRRCRVARRQAALLLLAVQRDLARAAVLAWRVLLYGPRRHLGLSRVAALALLLLARLPGLRRRFSVAARADLAFGNWRQDRSNRRPRARAGRRSATGAISQRRAAFGRHGRRVVADRRASVRSFPANSLRCGKSLPRLYRNRRRLPPIRAR